MSISLRRLFPRHEADILHPDRGRCCFAQDLRLPNNKESVRFAVLGDTGTGERAQYQTAEQVERLRASFPFDFVIMLGDNLYGGDKPRDFDKKFEVPYAPILKAGVKFYAALGNHDDPNQRYYKHFNMGGKRFYTFKPKDGVRFFALDSNYMDKPQIEWLEKELADVGIGLEDSILPSPPVLVGRETRT